MKTRTMLALALVAAMGVATAHADPTICQKQVIATMLKFKKKYMKTVEKCFDNENAGKIAGPCPDAASQLKIQAIQPKIEAKLETSCSASDLTTLGFTTCAFEPTAAGIESTCAALPVTSGTELADCMMCWKGAQMATYLGTLYASHVQELCGSALDETSPTCREFDCSTPLPVQGDVSGGEYDCQRAIAKGGVKHLVAIEKIREKCGLLGSDETTCDADLANQAAIEKSRFKMETLIKNKCGANRNPVADPPFCCRTAPQQQTCVAAADRTDCTTNLGGDVIEGKTCVAGSCAPAGGGGFITWWNTCPLNDSCTPSNDVTTLDDLISCVNDSAHESSDAMLCIQFPTGWTCPADAP